MTNFRRNTTIAVVTAALLLSWAALDDITTGNEPDYLGEYIIISLLAPAYGYLLGNLWLYIAHKFKEGVTRYTHFAGYHLHHSSLGIFLVLAGFILTVPWLRILTAGVGAGIFIHHLKTEGLIFITKD